MIVHSMLSGLLLTSMLDSTWGFSTTSTSTFTSTSNGYGTCKSSTAIQMSDNSFFGLPNPFSEVKEPEPPVSSASMVMGDDGEFDGSTDALIAKAKMILSTNLGITDPSMLADNFIWIGPQLGSNSLDKKDYVAAGKFFDVRSAFPDFDFRSHDFRIDSQDPMTVRLTARTTGTMRGKLRLRNEELAPTGKQMVCPPEAISITFADDGRVSKICSGFALDRQVGNTGGQCGVMAAATIGGSPPSDWEIYPATTVLGRFIGRPIKQLEEPTSFLAPFPETVMVQLAKGVFAANMAAADPTLLRDDFTYLEPYDGPVNKQKYLESYAPQMFSGYEPELTHFRVDPYDPYRVWVDVREMGVTAEGASFECPPQAFSFTFDDDGFCTRLTANAIMDPSLGNTGGLVGEEGIKYATGSGSAGIITRPLPQVLGRLRKAVLQPVTKVDVDQFSKDTPSTPAQAVSSPTPQQKVAEFVPKPPKVEPVVEIEEEDDGPAVPTLASLFASQAEEDGEDVSASQAVAEKAAEKAAKAKAAAADREAKARASLEEKQAKARAAAEAAAEAKRLKAQEARAKAEAAAAARKQAEADRKAKTAEAAAARDRQVQATANAKKMALDTKKAREDEAVEARQKAQEAKVKADQIARQRAEQAKAQKAEEERQRIAAEKKAKAAEAEAARVAKAEAAAEARRQAGSGKKRAQAEAAAAARKQAEEEKKRAKAEAAAAARRQIEDEKKAKAEAAAEVKRQAEEERQAKIAATKEASRKAAEARQAAAQQKIKEAEAKRAAATAAADAKRKEAAAKRAAAAKAIASKAGQGASISLFGFGQSAPQTEKAKQAENTVAQAKPGATISLFGFGQPKQEEPEQQERAKTAKETVSKAKPGATISLFGFGQKAEEPNKAARAQAAEKTVAEAKPGATISLFGFGQEKKPEPKVAPKPAATAAKSKPSPTISLFGFGESSPAQPSKSSGPKLTKAPVGVPTIIGWRKRRDGGISGQIYGSRNFNDGERVETSPITSGDVENGSVVTTGSGSRYFLSNDLKLRTQNKKAAVKDLAGAKPGATITLTKQQKTKDAQAAKAALEKAKPGATFSLFGLEIGFPANDSPPPAPKPAPKKSFASKPAPKKVAPKKVAPVKKTAVAPRGVPTLNKWRRNFDGSITGFVSGSRDFNENERVTTSKIASGKVAAGEVVQTGSGSKYFLA